EVDEEAHHRADVGVVHREALAAVVHRGPEAAELAHDRPAVLPQPVPDDLDEPLPADLLARGALLEQVLLDRVLRRDARVVVAGQKGRLEVAHAMPARERVGKRDLQRVTRVQRARDVRRRVRDHERLAPRAGLGVVETFVLPGALPALLDALGLVERFHSGKFTSTWASSFTPSTSSSTTSPASAGWRSRSGSRSTSPGCSPAPSPGGTSSPPRTRTSAGAGGPWQGRTSAASGSTRSCPAAPVTWSSCTSSTASSPRRPTRRWPRRSSRRRCSTWCSRL